MIADAAVNRRFCHAGCREATPYDDSVISVGFVVHLPYNETFIDEQMWIGAAVEVDNSRIWAAEFSVSVLNRSFADMVRMPSQSSSSSLSSVSYLTYLEGSNPLPFILVKAMSHTNFLSMDHHYQSLIHAVTLASLLLALCYFLTTLPI